MPAVNLKTLKVKLYPTPRQKSLLDEFIDTSRFVYNRTLEYINNGHKINFIDLRDILVTEKTRKGLDAYKAFDPAIDALRKRKRDSKDKDNIKRLEDEIKLIQQQRRDAMKELDYLKNPLINDFELRTPKDIRACAVKRCCDAFKTGFSNLKKGNIKHFKMKYKKKGDKVQSIELTPKIISIDDGKIRIAPEFFGEECLLRTHKPVKLEKISNNVDIVRNGKEYFAYLGVPIETRRREKLDTVAGVDLGIRTFATVHSHSCDATVLTEYKHRSDLLKKLNTKINLLKSLKRIRKKKISKVEKRKSDLIDRLHWEFINHLLMRNDVVYLGDIKSHDIVSSGRNKYLNVAFNDLKFYQLKQRLIYKASVSGKKVFLVPEHYTTKTCSCCGTLNESIGSKEVFSCGSCDLITGRDMNASKNMKMKGFFL